jgi:MurE/MurF fusion protein
MIELHNPAAAARWLRQHVTGLLRTDSRQVQPGDGFIAWPGAATDGRRHVAAALAQGAAACLVEQDGAAAFGFADGAIAGYRALKAATGPIASAYYDVPSDALDVLAVTGTNGKTSTAWWLAQALSQLPRPVPCGLVGTLGIGRPPRVVSTGLTTPDPVLLQQHLRHFANDGLKACAIEASSIGIVEQRLAGTRVRVAVFTNFTQDHLDYHGTMAAYWQAKAALFAWPGLRAAVLNIDDPRGAELAQQLAHGALDCWTVSCRQPARLAGRDIGYDAQGLHFTVVEGTHAHALHTRQIGDYNVSNLLGVIATLRALGVPLAEAVRACGDLLPVPGRMEVVTVDRAAALPTVVVDYAHTPDAIDKALAALRPLAAQRGGRLWCLFGCGGDRDPHKRPLMGATAERGADRLVITSDNPRSEQPGAIIGQIVQGLGRADAAQVQPDRAQAIADTLRLADARDVVLIAGKGHEDYQEIKGVRQPFSDQEQARAALQARAAVGDGEGRVNRHAMHLSLRQALAWLPGAQLVGDGATTVQRVHTDTRTLQAGDLFIALKGERFDGGQFLGEARTRGAVAALCDAPALPQLQQAGLAGIIVPDARLALGQLAAGWRNQFSLPLIAVTGSNGKTTVTQMVAAILRAWKPDTLLATQGNLNNDIGVPLTLLNLRARHEVAVVELGMNHPGEIAYLAGLARPTVALVNNAQREHQEFMATVEAVARENGAVIGSLPRQGVAVFPADDAYSGLWQGLAAPRASLRFALADDPAQPVDVRCDAAVWAGSAWQVRAQTPAGPLDFALHVAGRHNVKNALAAAACALAAGAPLAAIARGLAAFEPVKGRSRALARRLGAQTLTLIDDSYNANPDSVRAAIDVLAELPGPRLLVLGDMGEVGDQGPQFHAEVGAYARERGIGQLFTLGALCAHAAAAFGTGRHFDDMDALLLAVHAALPGTASIVVKGSRFMRMERVVEAITARPQQQDTEQAHAA